MIGWMYVTEKVSELLGCMKNREKERINRGDMAEQSRQTELSRRLTEVIPSSRQLAWQKLEFTAFFHYGMNTFTDKEWGSGKEDPAWFAPEALNTDQWCEALVSAGIQGCIITAKHHDGFCLWDTAYTEHSVMHSPFGKDIVGMLAESCRKYHIKFGIYLSPWDCHEPTYGYGKAYNDYFCSQLEELLTKYGSVYTVWFDGACGEGKNGRKQDYDWERYYALIRRLQPGAVISVCGPDVRWCGNEAGVCRKSEWSVVPARLFSQKRIAENSQKEDNAVFREKKLSSQDEDLGSRSVMEAETEWIWYPAEVDTSIRPGWFYHEWEEPKPLEKLLQIYLNSVGGNSVLLLNIPPCKDGYLAEKDCRRLKEIGDFIRGTFSCNLAEAACVEGLPFDGVCYRPEGEPEEDGMPPLSLTLTWSQEIQAQWIVLQEHIADSQRVEAFLIEAERSDGIWETVFTGTVIGYKKICYLNQVISTRRMRITFTEYRVYPTLKFAGVYRPVENIEEYA